MFRPARAISFGALSLALVGLAGTGVAGAQPAPSLSYRDVASCAVPATGYAACFAILHEALLSNGALAPAAASPVGYEPAQLQSAYDLPSSTKGAGMTVAIVDAYNDPDVSSDLSVYRSEFGLPSCTEATGCFEVLNESGQASPLPANNGSWSQEISLDVDMVSAVCPLCHIVLVEASSNSLRDLATSVHTAAGLGVNAISNSYGGTDSKADLQANVAYDQTGIAVTAAAGDGGYGVEYPASSPYVTAVGGTSLTVDSGSARGWSETAWSSTGSGCSAFEAQPAWQAALTAVTANCAGRAVADVSADANPDTGVAVYDSFRYELQSGWLEFGGTSVASPLIASVYALAGNTSQIDNASYAYAHVSGLNDVTSGSNGSCGGTDLCTAGPGWDGPTGLGTPKGTSAF